MFDNKFIEDLPEDLSSALKKIQESFKEVDTTNINNVGTKNLKRFYEDYVTAYAFIQAF